MSIFTDIGVTCPIVQAPMAGVSTPELAAAVSNAGGLGSIGIGAANVAGAERMIAELRDLTDRPFNVNVFVHTDPEPDPAREANWVKALEPEFERFNAVPPNALRTIYKSFAEDDDMLDLLVSARPRVVSFHFGLPDRQRIAKLKAAGCVLFSTATNLDEAQAAEAAGVDAIVAQGFEAGGHRGVFNPDAPDDCLGTLALTQLLVSRLKLPVIAAGGIMDGRGIASVLALGAEAAQLGTAFVACPESNADAGYLEALAGDGVYHTHMTRAISGRPARSLANKFTEWGAANAHVSPPDYPIAYDAGKQLHRVAKSAGDFGFAAHWAGQGAPLIRPLPAAVLVDTLMAELSAIKAGS